MKTFEERLWRFLTNGEKTKQQLSPAERAVKMAAEYHTDLVLLKSAEIQQDIKGDQEDMSISVRRSMEWLGNLFPLLADQFTKEVMQIENTNQYLDQLCNQGEKQNMEMLDEMVQIEAQLKSLVRKNREWLESFGAECWFRNSITGEPGI